MPIQKITVYIDRPTMTEDGEILYGDASSLLELLLDEETNRGYIDNYKIESSEDVSEEDFNLINK